jgi:hypothetical protein
MVGDDLITRGNVMLHRSITLAGRRPAGHKQRPVEKPRKRCAAECGGPDGQSESLGAQGPVARR